MPAGLLVPSRSMLPSMSMPHQPLNTFGTSSLTLRPSNALVSVSEFSHIMDQREKQTKEEQETRLESRSSSDNGNTGSADERDDTDQRPSKKSRYHRHSAVQIQEMERLFKECQHPDEKRRLELSKRLGLDPRQVKFWFQNKRTQIKAQVERQDNSHLRSDNEKLRAENYALREAIRNVSCPNCGGPTALGEMSFDEQQLHIENAKLREEIDKISAIAAKYVGRPIPSALSPVMSSPPGVISSGLDHQLGYGEVVGPSVADVASRPLGLSDVEKSLVLELAITSLEELVQVAKLEEPLWMFEPELGMEVLDLNYYFQRFPRGIGPTPIGLQSEASRATGLVIMNPNSIVDTLMDANRWSDLFSCIILRAATVEVLSAGVGGTYDGAMQLMYAELHLQTPLVPSREIYFLRYSKRIEGAWVVVDVAVDNLRGNPPPALLKCRRRPSGCIIEESPNGYSKITWLEHVEVDTSGVHQLYQSLVTCGRAFGAQRWVATLLHQSDRLVTTSMSSPHDVGVAMTPEGRRSMLRLAERMTHSFCGGVSASSSHTWITLSGAESEDVRVLIRKSVDEPGKILSAATSLWLPVPPSSVFDYLSNEVFRKEWDALSRNGTVEEKVHVSKGSNPGNSVSLLRVNIANSNESNMLILQDCCTDDSCSLVVYAPVDITAMSLVLNGGDADTVALLPSGFAILPDGNNENGCLLTVAFQILVDHVPSAKLSLGNVATVNNLISSTVTRIKSALLSDTAV